VFFNVIREDAMITEPTAEPAADKKPSKPPVHEINEYWPLRGAIWQHDGEHGPMYSLTVTPRYKDRNGKWQDGRSFGPDDLLALGELARDAYRWIRQRQREDARARREKESEPAVA
jgi:hypothetical protein